MWILLIEDNRALAANIGEFLAAAGDVVDFAVDGVSGFNLAVEHDYDVLVLDLNLPRLGGLALCRRLRENASVMTPVLMLTARDTLDDKVVGFEAGADDYLVKPFDLVELRTRLAALVRRAQRLPVQLAVDDLVLDPVRRFARRDGVLLKLTPTGLRLLEVLMRRAPGIVTHEELERAVWGDHPPDAAAALRVHIHGLRAVIDQPYARKLLQTVPGLGYRMAGDDDGP